MHNIPLGVTGALRLTAQNSADPFRISSLQLYEENEDISEAPVWEEPEAPVDLLLIAAHPDDELIWFGGLLPYYAGERGMKVLVASATALTEGSRQNELLAGLSVCRVRLYPEMGSFNDFQVKSIKAVEKRWGEGAAEAWCVSMIRRYRPRVVVTHDIRGESGHYQHQLLSNAVIRAVTELSADPSFDPESAEKYGTYVPQKLYIHRYRQNEIFMDWTQPLGHFGGESGASVARRAFDRHVSQYRTHYRIYTNGPMDSRYLGLYYSSVGEDRLKNDLFENCTDVTPQGS